MIVNWCKESGLYPRIGTGKIDTYKLFADLGFALTRQNGFASLVLPSGIYSDEGTLDLRESMFRETQYCRIIAIDNRGELFHIDTRSKFVLLCFQHAAGEHKIDAAFVLGQDLAGNRRSPNAAELGEFLSTIDAKYIELSRDLIAEFDPRLLVIPEFKNKRDVDLYTQINQRFPKLIDRVEGSWSVELGSDR